MALWRAHLLGAEGDWERVQQELIFGTFAYDTLPPHLLARFHLLAGRAATALGDYETANAELTTALEGTTDVALTSEINLARAEMAIALGEIDIVASC